MPENKKKRIKRIVFGILVLVVALIWSLPKKKEYIQTPSTHDEVIFLEVEGDTFSNGSKVWFALYDPECEYIEVCLSYPHRDFNFHHEVDKMGFAADGNDLGGWLFIGHSNYRKCVWRKHLVILIEDASEYRELTLDYLGDRVTIVR